MIKSDVWAYKVEYRGGNSYQDFRFQVGDYWFYITIKFIRFGFNFPDEVNNILDCKIIENYVSTKERWKTRPNIWKETKELSRVEFYHLVFIGSSKIDRNLRNDIIKLYDQLPVACPFTIHIYFSKFSISTPRRELVFNRILSKRNPRKRLNVFRWLRTSKHNFFCLGTSRYPLKNISVASWVSELVWLLIDLKTSDKDIIKVLEDHFG